MSDKPSLRSPSPTKRRSLINKNLAPPIPRSPRRSGDRSRKNEYSDPIPVLEPLAPYKVNPSSDPSLQSHLTTDKNEPLNIKVVTVGDGNTGKTCLLVTYAKGNFPEEYVPTVFENYLTKIKAPSGKMIELALWDTAGQEEYDRLRALSYPEVNILLVCFAIDAPMSLDNVYDKWIPEITHYCPDIPFILVGLKTDLRDDLTAVQHLQAKGQRPITFEEGKRAAQRCGAIRYMECSSKNRDGIADVFNQAISIVMNEKSGSRRVSGYLGHGSSKAPRELPRPPGQSLHDADANVVHERKTKKKRNHCVIL